MSTPPTFRPRLTLLFDHRRPWSAKKFAEAIKLHAVLRWPGDGLRQRGHAADLLARHRKHVRKIVSAKVGRGFPRYSEMTEKIEKDLRVLHGRLMNKKDMRMMAEEHDKDDPRVHKRLKQIDSMNLAVQFIKFLTVWLTHPR